MAKVNYREKFSEAVSLIKKRIIIIVILSAFVGFIGGYYKTLFPVRYTAKSVFYPDKKEATLSGSPLELIQGDANVKGGALGILGKVLNSRSVSKRVAMVKLAPPYNSKYATLADWIVEDNNMQRMPWEVKTDIKNISYEQRIAIASNILRNGSVTLIDENGFMNLLTSSYNKELAMVENQTIIDELIELNFEVNTQKSRENLDYITKRVDSIKDVYENVRYDNARFGDVNKYITKNVVKVPLQDLDERRDLLQKRYAKLLEMQDQAIIRYETDKPILKILDYPYIDDIHKPTVYSVGILLALFVFFITLIFTLRNIIIDIVKAELETAMVSRKEKDEPSTESK